MNIKGEQEPIMLQVFTMMFFSVAAFAGMALLSGMLIGSWPEVRLALNGHERTDTLPHRVPAGVRMVRRTRQPVTRPTMRAAA